MGTRTTTTSDATYMHHHELTCTPSSTFDVSTHGQSFLNRQNPGKSSDRNQQGAMIGDRLYTSSQVVKHLQLLVRQRLKWWH
eukprot:6204223-Amphidinium_carterae.1